MAIKIAARNVRITGTTKNESELEARYSGAVGFEVTLTKNAPPIVITIPFRNCQGMPEIMSRSLSRLGTSAVNLRTAIRNERTSRRLPSA